MKKWIMLAAAVLAASFAAAAIAEDGAPVFERPACDRNIDLDAGQDFAGTAANECVDGGSGQNQILLYGGRDYANGKDGLDTIAGDDGQDVLYGGKSGDAVYGYDGDDHIYTGCPNGCNQTGEGVANSMHGGSGDDWIGAANNHGADLIDCGPGYDVAYYDRGLDTVQADCESKRPQ